jgi:hypothetical protein
LFLVRRSWSTTSSSGASTGSWRSSSASTALKTTVVAPKPTASVRISAAVKPGVFANPRTAYRTSSRIPSNTILGVTGER